MNKRVRGWVFILCIFISGCGILLTEQQPTVTLSLTPTPTPNPNENHSATANNPQTGYQFTFDQNFIADAHVKGKGETCNGIRGPWNISIQVTGSPEPGATIETGGEAEFTLPEGITVTQVEIPTSGTGIFQTNRTTGTGDIQDPLLFIFELKPDQKKAIVTIASTGKGLITLHTQDGDRTIPYATVFTTQPQFEVSLNPNPDCP